MVTCLSSNGHFAGAILNAGSARLNAGSTNARARDTVEQTIFQNRTELFQLFFRERHVHGSIFINS